MRRLTTLLLLFLMAALGSGAAAYLHDLQHEREDAALVSHAPGGERNHHPPLHDETNCPVHAQLRAPTIEGQPTLAFVATAPLVDRLVPTHVTAVSCLFLGPADCRGPPVG